MNKDIRVHIRRLEESREEASKTAESKESELKRFLGSLSQNEIKNSALEVQKEIKDLELLIKLQEKNLARLMSELTALQSFCKHINKDFDSEGNKTIFICRDCGFPWSEDVSVSKFYHQ